MNRRELAKNGLLGLVGALFGKLPKKQKPALALSTWGTDSDITYHTYHAPVPANGIAMSMGWTFVDDPEEDGYSLSDGTEIEHGQR